ncbi:MAG: hypothetical protein AB7O97_23300 [Planctomycetota bacterium]
MNLRLKNTAVVAAVAACAGGLSAQGPFPDFTPAVPLVVLDTDSTVVQTSAGPRTVTGGVFRFRNVVIPLGTIVRGVGSNPLIILADAVTIDGLLTVSGGDGERVNTLGGANFPARGGVGGPAAGRGGDGSPQIGLRSFAGQTGNGPGNAPAVGGYGGQLAFQGLGPITRIGAGGGGGAFATAGDPHYEVQWISGTGFVQQLGIGGFGGEDVPSGFPTRGLTGGGPGGTPFVDGDDENDFFGLGYDVFAGRNVLGELGAPMGGSGGGGGGDLGILPGFLPPNFAGDAKGGGGGGGGGCLIVAAANSIVVSATGRITADGGLGGGGEQAGSSNQAGGGGAGSGGMLILAAGSHIELHVKGETYANRNYDFVLSADGSVCRTGAFLVPHVTGKYPANGVPPLAADQYDRRPLGGFGGMGIVELVVPVGNNADGTNTILDDNIRLMQNGAPLTGAQKQRFLAWRGWKNGAGVRVDDFGSPTNIGSGEGDIRPAPILIPLR